MKTLGYIAAIVGGAVAGATAALLLAPEKGEDTRAKIQDSVKDLMDKYKVQDTIKDFCDKHNICLSKKQVEELAEEVTEEVAEA